ncbi:MAG: hypothetical protein IT361_02215 [Gemmatimonadaceae bacterium]|nr:hypothetical protein [Gemmatimonadaceae bacterium]
MISVSVFGGFSTDAAGSPAGAALPRRLAAILAVLAVQGQRGIARERLLHLLWSDADPERSRHALTQSLYAIRRLLAFDDAIVGTAHLALNPERFATDVSAVEQAVAAGDADTALARYRGPLLDGFMVPGAPELERWIEEQRSLWSQRMAAFLDAQARARHGAEDHVGAVHVLRRRAALDPLDATAAIALMRALALAGDAPAGVQHARVYGELVRQELDLDPDPRVELVAHELLAESRRRPVVISDAGSAEEASASAVFRLRAGAARAFGQAVAWTRGVVPWWRRRSRRWRLLVRQGALTSAAVVVALLAIAQLGRARREAAPLPAATAILPFRATSLSGDLSFLPGGMVDLLSVALAARDTVALVDPETVHAWWDAAFGGRQAPAADTVLERAESLGARQVVTGTLVGNARQVVIRAALIEVPTRRPIAAVTASGALDSLPRLVDRLATLLVATAAGAGEAVQDAPDVDPRALRAFLQGRSAYLRADFRQAQAAYARALALDSALTASAVGLALASDWLEDLPQRARGLEVAERWRDRLPVIEQQQLVALQGQHSPRPSTSEEHFAAWERVARTGDRPELWADLGRRLLVDGRLAGLRDAEAGAAEAFTRALALDSTHVAARIALAGLVQGRAGAVRVVDEQAGGEFAPWLRWRRAVRARDGEALRAARAGFGEASDDALRRIAMSALAEGEYLDDGVEALRTRGLRTQNTGARIDVVLAEHAYALNAGSPSRALLATRRLADLESSGAHLRLRILDALYGSGDSSAAVDAVERLTARVGPRGESTVARSSAMADLCVLEQWRVWHGDYSTVAATVRVLSADGVAPPDEAVAPGGVACGLVLDALATALQGRAGASDVLARAEQLVLSGPTAGDLRQYGTLALALVREQRGELTRAHALVRRRSVARGWPRYLSTYLRTEARIAERLEDSAGAANALRQYLALRVAPDSAGMVDRAEVLSTLQRIEGRGPG